ncbi:hypothetical protein AVEN_78341-1 [Araneus ventricosus]|uniref:Uncharacterized protein n=1 Tax=Araneus ventricosus TaxID=182803 RepID=A0A4Y2J4K1_ARAVE|nr:hypothetical protein AVEN_78341-1 [Araneus ventricosus]
MQSSAFRIAIYSRETMSNLLTTPGMGSIRNKPLITSPTSASKSTLNDQPPRLHRALWPPLNSPITEMLMRRLPFLPSMEMGPMARCTPADLCR